MGCCCQGALLGAPALPWEGTPQNLGQENRAQGEKEMHRHLLVFIPPVITVPWHGDGTGGAGTLNRAQRTTTARQAGGRGYSLITSFFSWKEQGQEQIPPQERDTAAPGKGWCGLSSAPGRAFVPLWCRFRLQPSGPQHPLPTGMKGSYSRSFLAGSFRGALKGRGVGVPCRDGMSFLR